MTPYFVVGAPSVARRHLAGRKMLVSYAATLGEKPWVPNKQVRELSCLAAGMALDSGAFSVWKSGRSVDRGAYLAWLAEYGTGADFAICLDVIGDADASVQAWDAMRREPLPCPLVPVWHEGDPEEHLLEYAATASVVALGRVEGRKSRDKTLAFYDQTFNAAPTGTRFHALGIATTDVLERYPFASFDACSWERNTAYSNALPWPYSRCQRETRIRAHIEAFEGVEHRPPKQLSLRLVAGKQEAS